MTVAVDTNILFDVLLADPAHCDASLAALKSAAARGPTVICAVVYAELEAHFETPAEAERFLDDMGIVVDGCFDHAALHAAARAWAEYARARRGGIRCPRCGSSASVTCPGCGEYLSWRQHALPDFLVAGHALARGAQLLTRDRGFYRNYFPGLQITAPLPET